MYLYIVELTSHVQSRTHGIWTNLHVFVNLSILSLIILKNACQSLFAFNILFTCYFLELMALNLLVSIHIFIFIIEWQSIALKYLPSAVWKYKLQSVLNLCALLISDQTFGNISNLIKSSLLELFSETILVK